MTTDRTTYYPPEERERSIQLARQHVEQDRVIQGFYQLPGSEKGCWIGCHAQDRGIPSSHHAGLAWAMQWPEWLLHLADRVHEKLPEDRIAWWHTALVEAVPANVTHEQLERIRRRHLLRCIELQEELPEDDTLKAPSRKAPSRKALWRAVERAKHVLREGSTAAKRRKARFAVMHAAIEDPEDERAIRLAHTARAALLLEDPGSVGEATDLAAESPAPGVTQALAEALIDDLHKLNDEETA